jgi:hypothetical protein
MAKRDRQVKVMLTEAELGELTKRAGYEPLSSYCRRLLLGILPGHRERFITQERWDGVSNFDPAPLTVDQVRTARAQLENNRPKSADQEFVNYSIETTVDGPVSPEVIAAVESVPGVKRILKPPKTCAHGEAKGNNCWQCGGLAAVE